MQSQTQRKMLIPKLKITKLKNRQSQRALLKVNLMKQPKLGKSSLTCVSS